jgi:hypothetical protein
MQKAKLVGTALGLLLLVTCNLYQALSSVVPSSSAAQVRFSNQTSNVYFNNGLRFGSAQYGRQSGPGYVTNYYKTPPGTYSAEYRTALLAWVGIPNSSGTVEDGHSYTVTIYGDYISGQLQNASATVTMDS